MNSSHLTIVPQANIEGKLVHMKNLTEQIKVLQAELTMLKTEVIRDYFVNNEEYKTARGLLLASYKKQIQNQFQQSKFKEDHIDISINSFL